MSAQVSVIKTACLCFFVGWTFSVKKKTDKELSAQVPSKMAVMGGKKWKWMFCFFSLIIFQEKSCHLWKDVLVSMSKMYIRTWPTPAMGSLGTSLIYLCWFSRIQMPGLALEAIGQDNSWKVWQKSSAMEYNTWVHFWYHLTWHCFSLLLLASAAGFPHTQLMQEQIWALYSNCFVTQICLVEPCCFNLPVDSIFRTRNRNKSITINSEQDSHSFL